MKRLLLIVDPKSNTIRPNVVLAHEKPAESARRIKKTTLQMSKSASHAS